MENVPLFVLLMVYRSSPSFAKTIMKTNDSEPWLLVYFKSFSFLKDCAEGWKPGRKILFIVDGSFNNRKYRTLTNAEIDEMLSVNPRITYDSFIDESFDVESSSTAKYNPHAAWCAAAISRGGGRPCDCGVGTYA